MIIERPKDNYFMLSWLDEFMVGHKGFIAGGCFKNIFSHEKVKDLDVFFKTAIDFQSAVAYFDELCKESAPEYRFHYENDNVKAYKHIRTGTVLELCNKIYGTAEEVISQFDFTVSKFAYFKKEILEMADPFDSGKPTLESHTEYWVAMDDCFFEHLHLKRLVIDDKIPFPMSSFERMIRYIRYGYMPCKETKLKIANAINALTPEEVRVSGVLYAGMD